jgi:Domain of unknown function (DUF4397)
MVVAAMAAIAAVSSGAPARTVAAATAVTAEGSSQVTVVHGLRGQLVDVSLDGKLLLKSFQPDRLTDPMTVPAGPHRLELRPGGSPPGTPPKYATDLQVPAGKNLAVVAHFATDGSWTSTVYVNDPPPDTPKSASLLVFRNDATTSPVDVSLDGSPAVTGLANPSEATQAVPAAAHSVGVTSNGSVVVPANNVSVGSGDTMYLYLVGTTGAVTWLSQMVDAAHVLPATVSAGDSGLAATNPPPDRGLSGGLTLLSLAVLFVVAAVAVTKVRASRDRRRPHR